MVALATESDRTPAPQTTTLALSHERADAGGVESRDSITSKPPIMTAKEAALFDMLEQERQQRAGRSLRLLIVVALAVSVGLLLAAFLG